MKTHCKVSKDKVLQGFRTIFIEGYFAALRLNGIQIVKCKWTKASEQCCGYAADGECVASVTFE